MQPLLADVAALQREETPQSGAPVRGRSRTLTLSDGATVRWWVVPWQTWTLVFVSDVSAQQQLEQAARALISDLAHELRTPLATLLTHLEIMQLPDLGDDVRRQSVLFMRDETQRLVRLTNNALELGRLQASLDHSPAPVDLAALIADTVAQVTHDAQRKQIDLVTAVDPGLPTAWGQSDQLKQVFLNLLDNAIKYCHAHDTVTVAASPEGTGLACSVCDTGPGIDAQHRANVARRFYRGVPSGVPGSGLGLALVVEILRRHGSELQIESRTSAESMTTSSGSENEEPAPSSGTCMRFRLPRAGGGGA
jgi:two-component system phosphate regulon sensor histidine kinase PhoR